MDLDAINNLRDDFDVHYDQLLCEETEKLSHLMIDADALIVRNKTQVTKELIAHAPKLCVVGRLGVGLDNIDLKTCEENNIKVYPAIGANDIAVAEYVISSALILLRVAYHANQKVISGNWPRQDLIGFEAYQKTMGLIGIGSIARQVANRAEILGMTITAFDPYVDESNEIWQRVDRCHTIDELLSTADVVSIHVPLNKETHNLINESTLNKMKKNAILINTSRGGVVNEVSLVEALKKNSISGAALDVFENEPLSEHDAKKFIGLNNLILTPHIAGVTNESNVRVSAVTAENVRNELMSKL